MSEFNLSKLAALSRSKSEERGEWLLRAEDGVKYLQQQSEDTHTLLYASATSVFIHAFLVPSRRLSQATVAAMQHEMIPPLDDSWSIQRVIGGGKGHRMYLEPPLASVSDVAGRGEKLVFRRSFPGAREGGAPIEISQKLVHSLDLHYLPDRNSYCRLDARGDIEEVVKVYKVEGSTEWESLYAVTIRSEDLDKFMALSRTSLVTRFDFTRIPRAEFGGWGEISRYERASDNLYYHGGVDSRGSFCHGVLVRPTKLTVRALIRQWKKADDPARRKFATFKIYDRKNNRLIETSGEPGKLSNYFQESVLPWEISPAFFRPEVLLRFKADPEKFSLGERSISCRAAWHLPTFDINEAGQVHTYIGYLRDLPYEEQLYWQSFNEWPKGEISRRAFQTDIVGDFFLELDPLVALKRLVEGLDTEPPAWWSPRGAELAAATHYPATESAKEWADELLALDQLLVEGFLVKPLRNIAIAFGKKVEDKWATLRVIQEILTACHFSEEGSRRIMGPLQRLHGLRTEVRGHATGSKKRAAEEKARSDHGSLRQHYRSLAGECEESLRVIVKALGDTQR